MKYLVTARDKNGKIIRLLFTSEDVAKFQKEWYLEGYTVTVVDLP